MRAIMELMILFGGISLISLCIIIWGLFQMRKMDKMEKLEDKKK